MKTKVGLFGIGLETYWGQFAGLEDRLRGYLSEVNDKLSGKDVEVINLGLIDTPEKAMEAGHRFRQTDVDIIFLHVTTYALSSTVLPVVRRAGVPVIILNLSPEEAIDYTYFNSLEDRTKMTGEWLAYCAACPVHGPAHHCAVGVGHIASKIKKLGELLEIEAVQIC